MRYTLGELGGRLFLCDGILRSVRKSGGDAMRKWKSCLLLAAGMAVALSTAVMASQDKSDMVTVEVKNCKGGAVQVFCEYPEEMDQEGEYLPIGEKVQIPKGSQL